jgi:ankyrin repeat protein
LHFAVLGGRQETAKYLVRRGADLQQKDDEGVSALDVVSRTGDTRFRGDLELAAQMRSP